MNSVKMWKTRCVEYSGAATAALSGPGGGENPRSPRSIGAPPARPFPSGGGTPPEPTPEPAYKSGRQGSALVIPNRSRCPIPQNRGPGFACLPLVGGEKGQTVKNAPETKIFPFPLPPPGNFLENRSWGILDVFTTISLILRDLSFEIFSGQRFFERERRGFRACPDLHRFRGKEPVSRASQPFPTWVLLFAHDPYNQVLPRVVLEPKTRLSPNRRKIMPSGSDGCCSDALSSRTIPNHCFLGLLPSLRRFSLWSQNQSDRRERIPLFAPPKYSHMIYLWHSSKYRKNNSKTMYYICMLIACAFQIKRL